MGFIEDIAENHLEYLESVVGNIKREQLQALTDSSLEGRTRYYEISSELSHIERKISDLRKALKDPYSFDARKPLREALRGERSRILETLESETDEEKRKEIQDKYIKVSDAINAISS